MMMDDSCNLIEGDASDKEERKAMVVDMAVAIDSNDDDTQSQLILFFVTWNDSNRVIFLFIK